jgi:hypothetical protein
MGNFTLHVFGKKAKKKGKKIVRYHTPQKTCLGKFSITIWQISFIKKKEKNLQQKKTFLLKKLCCILTSFCKIRKQNCTQLQAHTTVPYQPSQTVC